MCFHRFDRSEPVHSAPFGPMYSAQYIGSRRHGGVDNGWSGRPWYRHRPDPDGALVEFRDRDYILVRWERGEHGQRSLYYMRADADPEHVCDLGPSYRDLEDAVALHINPELARRRIDQRNAREAEELRMARYAVRRQDLTSVVAELAPGTHFRDPAGAGARLYNIGKRWATWRYLEVEPDGVDFVQLKRWPHSEALWSMRSRGIVIDD